MEVLSTCKQMVQMDALSSKFLFTEYNKCFFFFRFLSLVRAHMHQGVSALMPTGREFTITKMHRGKFEKKVYSSI